MEAVNFNNRKTTGTIEHGPKCYCFFISAFRAQELLTSFADNLKAIILQPGKMGRVIYSIIDGKILFDCKAYGGFLELKKIKQLVRGEVNAANELGHSDTHPQTAD